LVERKYGGFVSVNLNSSLPQWKLHQNLRGLGMVNAPERPQVEMDVERLNNYFLTRPLLNGAGEFAVSLTNNNVPEFSFDTVAESVIYDTVMSIMSDAAGVDGITLSFITLLLPVVLPVLTHIFNHIFVSFEFPGKWKTSVVLPIPRVSNLLTVFQSGYRRHHCTTAAVLKVKEDIRLSMEDGQVTVLLLLDFSQAFEMVVHWYKVRNTQNYSVGAGMMVGSYPGEQAQFVIR
jgi:hypothetical protein